MRPALIRTEFSCHAILAFFDLNVSQSDDSEYVTKTRRSMTFFDSFVM